MPQTPDEEPQVPSTSSEGRKRTEADENLSLLRVLRDVSEQARRDRHRQTSIIIFVISALFLVRQVLPPAWTVWLPL